MLNKLEQEVIKNFFKLNRLFYHDLNQKIMASVVESRDYSSIGFITQLEVPNTLYFGGTSELSDKRGIEAYFNNKEVRAMFVLYIENGFVSSLEGRIEDGYWPPKIDNFQLIYNQPQVFPTTQSILNE